MPKEIVAADSLDKADYQLYLDFKAYCRSKDIMVIDNENHNLNQAWAVFIFDEKAFTIDAVRITKTTPQKYSYVTALIQDLEADTVFPLFLSDMQMVQNDFTIKFITAFNSFQTPLDYNLNVFFDVYFKRLSKLIGL